MVEGEAVIIDSSESERYSMASSTERASNVDLARKRREWAQSKEETVAADIKNVEAELEAKRSASNTRLVGRLKDFESDGGNSS